MKGSTQLLIADSIAIGGLLLVLILFRYPLNSLAIAFYLFLVGFSYCFLWGLERADKKLIPELIEETKNAEIQ